MKDKPDKGNKGDSKYLTDGPGKPSDSMTIDRPAGGTGGPFGGLGSSLSAAVAG